MPVNKVQTKSKNSVIAGNISILPALEAHMFRNIPVRAIDFSPLNYRKHFSQQDLENFAKELSLHGIISPLTVRILPSGRYELVAGERRLRAAVIAGLKEVPATIKSVSDEEVIEIQLAENIQRENPHPLHEAFAIGQMQKTRKTIDEIAARLGKTKQFVYCRIKLLSLIEPFQDMFLADILNMQQSIKIAGISAESQEEFFEAYGARWKKDKSYFNDDLEEVLEQYTYDLKCAPFNPKDKKLHPEAGACTACPSNTATLKSLFPEYAKQSVCTNKECYHRKCALHLMNKVTELLKATQPAAFIFKGKPTPALENMISILPDLQALPRFDYDNITILCFPETPSKEDFTDSWNNDDDTFDEAGYEQAMQEYHLECDEYQLQIDSGSYQKGIMAYNQQLEEVWFKPEPPVRHNQAGTNLTSKIVQAAIQNGTATVELLQGAMDRMQEREKRALEIDREKVQVSIHSQFLELITPDDYSPELNPADLIAAKLVIYQALDYATRAKVNAALFGEEEKEDSLYERLSRLTDQQYGFLIRMAIAGKPDSKSPFQEAGIGLYQIAKSAGLNIEEIEEEQHQKALKRQTGIQKRLDDLARKMQKLNDDSSTLK